MTDDQALDDPADDTGQPEVEQGAESESPAESPGASLTLLRGGAETEHVFPFSSPAVLGRFDPSVGPVDVDLGVVEEGKYVSRKHAEIEFAGGAWRVSDLGSSNGTFVLRSDFERVESAEIADGDQIALGNARFKFRVASEQPGESDAAQEEEPEQTEPEEPSNP
jgi:hypothetical protein